MWFLYFFVSLLAVLAIYLAWFSFQLFKQNGRVLARVITLEKRLDNAQTTAKSPALLDPHEDDAEFEIPRASPGSKHPSLTIGDTAPDFTLPDLSGVLHAFSEWKGRPILLIFSSANCGFCTEMGPDLAAIDISGQNSLMPMVVTNGSSSENLEWVEEHGFASRFCCRRRWR